MKPILGFIKTTLLGGLLVVLPVWLVALLMLKAIKTLAALIQPVVHELPEWVRHPWLIAAVILLLLCFFIGLAARTGPGKWMMRAVESSVLERVPGYTMIRSFTQRLAGSDAAEGFAPVLVELEDALVPAFLVERHADSRCTVFVPSSPTPAVGAIYILASGRVHELDVTLMKAIGCVSKWGTGSAALLAAMKSPPRDRVRAS